MRRIALLVLVSACGRLWFDPLGVAGAGPDDHDGGAIGDGGCLGAGVHDVRAITDLYVATRSGMTFGTPVQMAATPNVNYGPSWSPTGDQLRTSLSSPWVLEGVLSQLTVGNEVGWPALSPDGLTLYFEMIDGAGAKIYMATRASKADAFENPTFVPGLITGNIVEVSDPDISCDATAMVLSARRASSPTGFDIDVSTRFCS